MKDSSLFLGTSKETLPAHRFLLKRLIRIFDLAVFIVFWVVPFMHNYIDHVLAQQLWYPCALYVLLSIVADVFKIKKPLFKTPTFEFARKWGDCLGLVVFTSVFVFNYYEIDYIWKWVVFAAFAVYAPIFFFSVVEYDCNNAPRGEDDKRIAYLNATKNTFLYWFYDLFYMALFNDWFALIYVFGIIAIVAIFYNLAKAFLTGNKTLGFLLPFDFLIGIGISVYLIYIIPDASLQIIVLTITAAVYGGLLTLVGVAWTIKNSEANRIIDLQRIEEERREEERKKHIPYIKLSIEKQVTTIASVSVYENIDFSDPDDTMHLRNNTFYTITIADFSIKNIATSNIILKGIIINNKYYSCPSDIIIEPNTTCVVQTTRNWSINLSESIQNVAIILSDILGHKYSATCNLSLRGNGHHMICTNETGEKFFGLSHDYIVDGIALPALIDIEESKKYG